MRRSKLTELGDDIWARLFGELTDVQSKLCLGSTCQMGQRILRERPLVWQQVDVRGAVWKSGYYQLHLPIPGITMTLQNVPACFLSKLAFLRKTTLSC